MDAFPAQSRNTAIDILRGLTLFLMVLVNDLWTVRDVPGWIGHMRTHQDAMGLADTVFPLFLFCVGLSIPLALERRFARGASGESVLGHILSRSLALLLMGVFIVNGDGSFAPVLGYGKALYWTLMVAGFFLVWNRYPEGFRYKLPLQILGIGVLAFLAFTFRNGDGRYLRASWWGILGMIGWAYLFCAMAWLLVRKKPGILILLWLAVCVLNMLTTDLRSGERLIKGGNFLADFASALQLDNGASALMVLGGMLTTWADRQLSGRTPGRRLAAGLAAAVVLALLGWGAHQFWITSKNLGTLPWCLYVSAMGVAAYSLLRGLERKGWIRWAAPLRFAGTAALTVYMIPYLFESLWVLFSLESPAWLSGGIGILKCALFSLLCIGTAWLFGRLGLKLKI